MRQLTYCVDLGSLGILSKLPMRQLTKIKKAAQKTEAF